MNGRKARARRRAQTRSRSNAERFKRKGEKVIADEKEQAVAAALVEARKQRDERVRSARQAYDRALKEIAEIRGEAIVQAEADFEKQRAKILRTHAEERAAA